MLVGIHVNSPFICISFSLSPVRVISRVCLLHVSDSSMDDHLIQTPGEPTAPLLRLGARHHRHGHQQVSSLTFTCIISKLDNSPRCIHQSPITFVVCYLLFFFCLSIGGLILDKTVSDPNLAGIVVYTPVINGKTGSLWNPFSRIKLIFNF